eukprot:CAMPEP_0203676422 /NCGR_PEP_ID=MMETSP0090-20130426/24478_1 /ASSEMBLY_ACC=CAM_ASM_001088 /TAXON_ID=426623 /ORGANISM="Chaetoceros affinis, Strain CCMP159" /LENGTH=443 /DNA_ID=CAMNT_0050542961 /DNA_START=40 /DNA_END=1371 /DNA_ORIENTATION=+
MKFTNKVFLVLLLEKVLIPPSCGVSLSDNFDDFGINHAVVDTTFATQLSGGGGHSCVVDNDNNLKCWGYNKYGQLGDGTTVCKNTPTLIALGTSVATNATQIALGGMHSCAIDNLNKLLCWGANRAGQLGDGTNENKNVPTVISLGHDSTYATQIALGGSHSCSIDSLGNLLCWGSNAYGQLGDGTGHSKNIPTIIPLGGDATYIDTYPTQIALGNMHSCAIDNLNSLLCWGDNWYGQLGDGTYDERKVPTVISLGDNADATFATKIALGADHSCTINNKNSLKCWGDNMAGQLGDGTYDENRNTPTTIYLGDDDTTYATHIALGNIHSCAIDNLNELQCWGNNFFGQLGDGTNNSTNTPTIISVGDNPASLRVLGLGDNHSCIIDDLNNLLCWGSNYEGQLGDGTNDSKNTPTSISVAQALLDGRADIEELKKTYLRKAVVQ